tara:strand:+ start:1547 stop:1717 length:171 start_codon:yes stop_codon:yes gene_type:complete
MKKPNNPGLKKLPEDVRNKMGYMKGGGKIKKKKKKYMSGGKMYEYGHGGNILKQHD